MARFTRCLSGYGLIINFVKNPIFVSVDRGCSQPSGAHVSFPITNFTVRAGEQFVVSEIPSLASLALAVPGKYWQQGRYLWRRWCMAPTLSRQAGGPVCCGIFLLPCNRWCSVGVAVSRRLGDWVITACSGELLALSPCFLSVRFHFSLICCVFGSVLRFEPNGSIALSFRQVSWCDICDTLDFQLFYKSKNRFFHCTIFQG